MEYSEHLSVQMLPTLHILKRNCSSKARDCSTSSPSEGHQLGISTHSHTDTVTWPPFSPTDGPPMTSTDRYSAVAATSSL